MNPGNGTHTLTANGATSQLVVSGTVGSATYDTFDFDATLDLWVARKIEATIRFMPNGTLLGWYPPAAPPANPVWTGTWT